MQTLHVTLLLASSAAALTVGGCEPQSADLLLGTQQTPAFAVEATSLGRSPLRADSTIVVRFSRDLDPRSVGARSVRVFRTSGRPVPRLRLVSRGRELRITPAPGREFPPAELLTLRIEGGGSPRSIRAAGGELLLQRFEARFEAGPTREPDLTGASVVSTAPRDGAEDVAPGSTVEIRLSEPVARGAIASGAAVTLRVDGREEPARVGLSEDLATLVVRPRSPLPPDRAVQVEVHANLLDLAGNPLDASSPRVVRFRTRATSLHEVAEDFAAPDMNDGDATTCGWDDAASPGLLVERAGRLLVPAPQTDDPPLVLGSAEPRFQLLVPATDVADGVASGLRLRVTGVGAGPAVLRATVEAGPTALDAIEPAFLANRAAADLREIARLDAPAHAETTDRRVAFVEIPFSEPLRLERGRGMLLDVRIALAPGVQLAAFRDSGPWHTALIEAADGPRSRPAAWLLVSGGAPQARSRWYDTGVERPGWQTASVVRGDAASTGGVAVEFQSAPGDSDGGAEAALASEWTARLEDLPAYRFVRFRVRFDAAPGVARARAIDRVVMPYVSAGR